MNRTRLISLLYRCLAICFMSFCLSANVYAQIQVTGANTPVYTPETLIENIFLGDGVEVTNITYSGTDGAVGAFTNGLVDIGLERGIVMSSGLAETAAMINNAGGTSGATSGGGLNDIHLAATTTVGIQDLCRYEISFIPTSDTLRFTYVFASEEYPEYACSPFNDVFGFFIQGPVPGGMPGEMYDWENIALIPDPADPSGTTFLDFPVTINFVNDGVGANGMIGNCTLPNGSTSFGQYYNTVGNGDTPTYDGYLDVFIAQAIVTPCEEYTIKLAIADGQDNQFDSSVFLEAKSFGTGSIDVIVETISIDGSIAEGCDPGILTISLPNETESDLPVEFEIIDDPNLPNIATNGVDYEMLSNNVVIPAGETSVSFPLQAYEDFINEGDEYIYFDIQKDICNRDTLRIIIRESIIEPPLMPNDTSVCSNETAFLDSDLSPTFMLPEPPSFSYSGPEQVLGDLNLDNVSYTFEIDVQGVAPQTLGEGVIKSVCIDSMSSIALDFTIYDFYLIGPNGQILELMTDIGQGLSDGTAETDTIINVCFTPGSTVNINNGNPLIGPYFPANPTYTGNFLPEGVFSDLWDGDFDTNGTWSLLIYLDEKPIPLGVINAQNVFKSWSICFNSVYSLDYSWSSNNGFGSIDCPTCEDINVNPTQSTWYYLTLEDSYGCETVDSVFVEVIDVPDVANLSCNVISSNTILFDWDDAPMGYEYEVEVNGDGNWLDINDVSEHIVTMLDFNETITLNVRIISQDGCIGNISSESCTTPSCVGPTVMVDIATSPSCVGFANGNIQLSASGTPGPYEFVLGTDTVTSGFFTNLDAGIYDFIVLDADDCAVPFQYELTGADTILTDILIQNEISCFGDVDGQLTVMASGGTGFFTYAWSNGDMGNLASDLSEGWHFVTVEDSNLCETVDSFFLINPIVLEVDTILVQNVSCFGFNDGEAEVLASGGTANYTYQWSDPGGSQLNTVGNLSPGVISVTVTDGNMCSDVSSVLVEEPDQLQGMLETTNISCFDTEDGVLEALVTGGFGMYSYSWSSGGANNPETGLGDGLISVTVTDENLCSIILSENLQAPQPILIQAVVDSVDCFNGVDGSIEIMASGGTGMLSYNWDSGEMSNLISGKQAGEYCVTVTDQSMCSSTACYTISQPEDITLTTAALSVGCNGALDGQIDIEVQGGVPSFTFNWTGPNMFTSTDQNPTNLAPGIYSVTVTDHYDCSAVATEEVLEDDPILVMNTNVDVRCFGDTTGSISLEVSGGSGALSYSWSGPNGFMSANEDIDNLPFGQYSLTITDENNCQYINSYLVNQPASALEAMISPVDTICFGDTTGMLTVTPLGGTLPYQIEWNNGETGNTISNLSSGVYSATITDLFLCTYEVSSEVVQREAIAFALDLTNPLCYDDANGSATVTDVFYGQTPANIDDFTMTWSSQPGNTSPNLTGLVAGNTYFVTITDDLGCTGEQSFQLEEPDPISVELIDKKDISCYLGEDGEISVEAIGGTTPFTYEWGQNAQFQIGEDVSGLKSGSYVVTATDINGCTGTGSITLIEPIPIDVDFRVFNVFCKGGNDGEVEVIPGGGTSPFSFNWSTGSDSSSIENLSSGEYILTLTDGNGCEVIDTVFVAEPENPLDLDAQANNVLCAGGRDGSIDITGFGGTGIYAYSVDGISFTGSPTQIGLEAGVYTVYIRDSNGCTDSLTNVVIDEAQEIFVDLGEDITVAFGEDIALTATVSNTSGDFDYLWESFNEDKLNCSDCPSPALMEIIEPMVVCLTVTDENGCTAKDLLNVYVEKFNFIRVPTGFTPNNDGVNDLLNVYGREGTIVESFRIYSRWGEKVFELNGFEVNDTSAGWDGTFKNKEMNSEVFVWVAELLYLDGTKELVKGNTTLIR